MDSKLLCLIFCLIAPAIFASSCFAVVYVDQNAPGPAHDGTTWDTAFLTIQEGVDAATPGGELWVADGVYVENVAMGEGVQLYGGFLGAEPGGYEESLDQRDFVNNVATIDGNQSGSCVVMAVESRVDGFTITNGSGTPGEFGLAHGGGLYCNALGESGVIARNLIVDNTPLNRGGGICCVESSPLVVDNTIRDNWTGRGGAIYCRDSSSPTVTGNTITNNVSSLGAAIYCSNSSPDVIYNMIADNSAQWGDGLGAGIYCSQDSAPTITGNSILTNSALERGGGVCCQDHSSPDIAGNLIACNSATGNGGGISCYDSSSPHVADNVIVNNSADDGGGIFCALRCSPILTNNTIIGNCAADMGAGVALFDYSSPHVSNNIVAWNASDGQGGGILCGYESVPLLSHNDFWANEPDDYYGCDPGEGDISADPMLVDPENGDYHLSPESPCIDAGWNDAPGLPEEDFEGDPRIIWAMKFPVPYWPHPGYVDIGADEYVPPPRPRWPRFTMDTGQ